MQAQPRATRSHSAGVSPPGSTGSGEASAELTGYFVCNNGNLGNSNEPSGSDGNSGRSMSQGANKNPARL